MTREKQLELSCVEYAKRRGWLAYKLCFLGRRGAPDRLFVSPAGGVLFVEFKSLTGRVSDAQKIALDAIKNHHVVCGVCRSLGDFQRLLGTVDGLTGDAP